ncbi:alanine racemase [Mesorhizobium sp. INR15]|uniref:alanine racemase n=1 Tax=Mesorhizobium sp. INR15 TaxID=2654248 RepID=UPI001896A2F8|nr:alanine racemase [Mesorhizobium sp. INR15]QPC89372.1 YhfX family PLP-dependent enzyme [Mesorhizobium sp. INR15]
MFLDVLRRRNPGLIEAAIRLHQDNLLPANTYVIDTDAAEHNARIIREAADRAGLKVFGMTKQMSRNAAFCAALMRGGISESVAVDMECARATHRAGMGLGHLGHLVQVPRAEANAAAAMMPRYWTVFNDEKAREAGAAMQQAGHEGQLLARIFASGDTFYNGHEGGFPAEDIVAVADRIDAIGGARFAGITTFPAQLFDARSRRIVPTHNTETLRRAAEALARAGRKDIEINAPGTTSSVIIEALKDVGATQCEPGHGLTGTTPLHALEDLPELPAVAYVSEVSHIHQQRAYCFGGGLYIDPVFPDYALKAIVSREPTTDASALRGVEIPPPAAIDYYGMIDASGPASPRVGDSVVFGFRPQAFVTRAYVAGISGISRGAPKLEAIHDSYGHPINWPAW